MASPSTACSMCLRQLWRTTLPPHTSPRGLLASTRAYRPYSPPRTASLYLDFLAPATRGPLDVPRPSLQKTSPSRPFKRPIRSHSTASAPATPDPAPQLPPQNYVAHAIVNPRLDSDGKPMQISLSPRATHRLAKIVAADNNPEQALRVTIESGGCHGFQYLMDLVDLSKEPAAEDDTVFEGEKGAKVVIDEASLELLNGSTVDYTMELIGSQFKITDIPGATTSCGCGTSFDIKM